MIDVNSPPLPCNWKFPFGFNLTMIDINIVVLSIVSFLFSRFNLTMIDVNETSGNEEQYKGWGFNLTIIDINPYIWPIGIYPLIF